jgi:hypothetical protein
LLDQGWWLPKTSPWLGVFIIGVFNTCHAVGTCTPAFCKGKVPPAWVIQMITFLRTGLIVAAIYSVPTMTTNKFLLSTPWLVFNLTTNGLLMGILVGFSMVLGTKKSDAPGFSQKIAGYIMTGSIVLGLSLGSIIGFLMGKVVN